MPYPWVSLRCDQITPVNKAVNKKEPLEKGLEAGLPDFSWYIIPKPEKMYQIPSHKISQMSAKYSKCPQNIPNGNKKYKHF
jgi:hypothetical protein